MAFTSDDFFMVNGTVDCSKFITGYAYDHKLIFMDPNTTSIPREILEVPDGAQDWEIALTSVSYQQQNENLFSFPHPDAAKFDKIYHLYDGEIMIGALPFFPINYLNPRYVSGSTAKYVDIKAEFSSMYGITDTAANYITNNYQKNLDMWTDFEAKMKTKNRADFYDWYSRSLDSIYVKTPGEGRCPFFRFNFLDRLLETYPQLFAQNNNKFAMLNFQQITSVSFASTAALAPAETYALHGVIDGFKKTPLLFNKNCFTI